MVSLSDVVTWCFLVTNTARLLAYLPQVRAAWRCSNGAQSVSRATWGYFAAAHVAGAVYAVIVSRDPYMAAMFSCNFSACTTLLAVITWKRRQQRARTSASPGIERLQKTGSGSRPDRDENHLTGLRAVRKPTDFTTALHGITMRS